MTTWEYKARNLNRVWGMNLERDFNKIGREGWEFVAITGEKKDHYAIFKRRLAGAPEPAVVEPDRAQAPGDQAPQP